jgi:hypothetical protein
MCAGMMKRAISSASVHYVQKFQNTWKLLYEVWKGFCSAATLALQLGTRCVLTRCVLPMVLTEP